MKQKYITRVDSRRTHGYFVRVPRPDGSLPTRLFSDGKYGGRGHAYRAAIAYRNELEIVYGWTRTNRWHVARPCRTATGVKGVRRGMSSNSEVFIVDAAPHPYKVKRTSVSIRKHGEATAFDLACRIRMGWEMEILRG